MDAPGRVLPIRCDCTDDAAVSRAFDVMHETGHPTAKSTGSGRNVASEIAYLTWALKAPSLAGA